MSKLALLAATEKGFRCLQALTKQQKNKLGMVCSFPERDVSISYDRQITDLCKKAHVPYLSWQELKAGGLKEIKKHDISAILAIGWRYLLPMDWDRQLKHGIFVIHDSLLPKYRGFAPTPTAIIYGEKETGATLLRAAEEMDAGDILLQKSFQIKDEWYVQDIIREQSKIYEELSLQLIEKLEKGLLKETPQDHAQATYSIWRNKDDCRIDWNVSALQVRNLIRAVSHPYPGAYTYLEDKKVTVNRAELIHNDVTFVIRQPGKIWKLDEKGFPIIVCRQGLIKITDAECDGHSLLPLSRFRQRFN